MALRVWKDEPLMWQAAQERLRSSFHQVLAQYIAQPVQEILDIGCSVGISTLALHRCYQSQQNKPVRTVGLDSSPCMLTVARHRDTNSEITQWLHANAEETGLSDRSFDLVTLQFVIHELPRQATIAIFRKALPNTMVKALLF
jgi:ubiquinone/menaquinone biosynthesis C-methylase UbiE